jgi:hypothetical protein
VAAAAAAARVREQQSNFRALSLLFRVLLLALALSCLIEYARACAKALADYQAALGTIALCSSRFSSVLLRAADGYILFSQPIRPDTANPHLPSCPPGCCALPRSCCPPPGPTLTLTPST